MRRITSGSISFNDDYPPDISNPVNTNYMFIEKLNQYTEEQIIGLKNEDNKLRLLIEEQPDIEKLKLLKEAIINETTEVTLVMRSNNNNLIAFSYFECISDNIIGVESYNYTENILKTIEGISIFRNLRSIVIDALYDNKLCIDELVSLEKLEELCISFYPITKYQYPTLNKLNRLKRLKIKGLDSNILSCLPNLETLTCFNLKDGAHLGIKAPNLRSIDIYRSPKILNLNFLLDLKELRSIGLDGLSNVEEMPDLSNLHSLTGMSLANMKRLQSFPLYHENLKNLLLQLPFDVLDNIIPENLPNLKHISVNLGSDKKNGMVLDRFKGICEVGIW